MENAPEIKASLLIVEDEEAVRESLRAVLECDGYHCDGAENGTRALEMVSQQFYNIMLVDYRLPDMNGLEFIKQALVISKDSVPLIVTGCSSLEIALEGMRAGAHDYLVKPVGLDELKKNLEGILQEREVFLKGKTRFQEVIKEIKPADEKAIERIIDETGQAAGSSGGFMHKFMALFKP